MCMKLPPENLNPGPYPQHTTNIYICGVTTELRVRGDFIHYLKWEHSSNFYKELNYDSLICILNVCFGCN